MSPTVLLLLAVGLGLAGWLAGRARAWSFRASRSTALASLPNYHGWYVALWALIPALLFLAVWSAVSGGLVTQADPWWQDQTGAPDDPFVLVITAAEGCPVDVIKFETKEAPGAAPWANQPTEGAAARRPQRGIARPDGPGEIESCGHRTRRLRATRERRQPTRGHRHVAFG